MRVLVTGATGYIGSRLVPSLLASGHAVRCLTRSTDRLATLGWSGDVEAAEGDLTHPSTLPPALSGVDAAYYLVHSLGRPGFEEVDRTCADNFALAAESAGTARIIHLGGPAPRPGASPHLRSRGEVADRLLASGVPTIVLRAAIILGSGSASFEMLRYLTERLPAMLAPRWVRNRVQPIAARDVLHYLTGVLGAPPEVDRGFDIGGPDRLTYGDLIQRYAAVAGLPRRVIVPVRPLTPELSALWVGLVTPVPGAIARPLVAGLIHEAISREHDIAGLVPEPPGGLLPVDRAIRLAMAHRRGAPALPAVSPAVSPAVLRASTASPAPATARSPEDPLPSDPPWAGGTVYTDRRDKPVAVASGRVWEAIRAATAAGTGTGGRWRTTHVVPGEMVLRSPAGWFTGSGWLEMRAEPVGPHRSRYRQVLTFLPRGLAGVVAWQVARPWRVVRYGHLARAVVRRARARNHSAAAAALAPAPGPAGTRAGAGPSRAVAR